METNYTNSWWEYKSRHEVPKMQNERKEKCVKKKYDKNQSW